MDWKTIKPITEHEALSVVNNYFTKHGYTPERIDTKKQGQGKQSPDIIANQNSKAIFICEVKTPEHILNKTTGMYHWDTTFNKIRGHIHKASKQFVDFDKNHILPRILAFTSNHPQLNWTGVHQNIFGMVKMGDQILKDYRNKPFVIDTNKDINSIDAYLWMQINYINRQSIAELAIYLNESSTLKNQVDEITKNLIPFAQEGIKAPRYSAI